MSKSKYFLEMSNVIHALVRGAILNNNFKQAYQSISLQLFPLFESSHQRDVISFSKEKLQEIAFNLKYIDEASIENSTCTSIALTIQATLFANGVDSFFVIGVNNKDQRLNAHAWVDVPGMGYIDNKNEFTKYKEINRLSMYTAVERWFESENENMDSDSRKNKSLFLV